MDNSLVSKQLAIKVQESQDFLSALLAKQKKLNPTKSLFSIRDNLEYIQTAPYLVILASEEILASLAAKIFKEDTSLICVQEIHSITEHCAKVSFKIKGKLQAIYIKDAWEGAIKEAIGIEFNNLLTTTPIRYLCNDDLIITEEMFEPITPQLVYSIRDTHEYLYAYGVWEVFTRFLHLTDRKTSNICWDGQQLANIDFGLVFYRGNLVFDSRFTITEDNASRQQGQIHALNGVLNKLEHPKVQLFLLNLDSEFCLGLKCHRHMKPPLKTMISIFDNELFKNLYEE